MDSSSAASTPVVGAAPSPQLPPSDPESGTANSTSRGNSPIPVPLICPRYQSKTRTKNSMEITDSYSSEEQQSASELLRQRSHEALKIKHGAATYEEHMRFHAYSVFKHGSRTVVTQSIGYSSDGDLVLHRHDLAEVINSGMSTKKVTSNISSAVCLDPASKRPLTDTEEASKRRINASKLKKYPGIKAPKNKKIRNRLHNDHFQSQFGRRAYDMVADGEDDSEDEASEQQGRSAFGPVPDSFNDLIHKESDQQFDALIRKGITPYGDSPVIRPQPNPEDLNSAELRFVGLEKRLREELKRALKSEVLTTLISELETRFEVYILKAQERNPEDPPLDPIHVAGLDGYGRLICHSVAAFYKLNSASADAEDGSRVISVSVPKRIPDMPTGFLLTHLKGGRGADRQQRNRATSVSGGAASDIMPELSLGDSFVTAQQNQTRKNNKRRKMTKKR